MAVVQPVWSNVGLNSEGLDWMEEMKISTGELRLAAIKLPNLLFQDPRENGEENNEDDDQQQGSDCEVHESSHVLSTQVRLYSNTAATWRNHATSVSAEKSHSVQKSAGKLKKHASSEVALTCTGVAQPVIDSTARQGDEVNKELPEKPNSTTRSTLYVPHGKRKKKFSEYRRDFKLPHIPAKLQPQNHSPGQSPSMVPQLPLITLSDQPPHLHIQQPTKKKVFNMTLDTPIPLFAVANNHPFDRYKPSQHYYQRSSKSNRLSKLTKQNPNQPKPYAWSELRTANTGTIGYQSRPHAAPSMKQTIIDPSAILDATGQQTDGFKGKRLVSYKDTEFSTKPPLPQDNMIMQLGTPETAADLAVTSGNNHSRPAHNQPEKVTRQNEPPVAARNNIRKEKSMRAASIILSRSHTLRRRLSTPSLSRSSTAWDINEGSNYPQLRRIPRIERESDEEEEEDREVMKLIAEQSMEVEGQRMFSMQRQPTITTTSYVYQPEVDEDAPPPEIEEASPGQGVLLDDVRRDMARIALHSMDVNQALNNPELNPEKPVDTSYLVTYEPDKKTRAVMNQLRATGKNRSLGHITAEVMDDYSAVLDEIDAVTYYSFRQAEEVLQNYTPQNVVLISSSVPKAEVLKETVLPGGLAWIYDFTTATYETLLNDLKNILDSYKKGAKAKNLAIVCKGGPGYMYLLKGKPVTPAKISKDMELLHFWKKLGTFMSKVSKEQSMVHFMESNVGGNKQGEELLFYIEAAMYCHKVKVQAPIEFGPSGRKMLETYYDVNKFKTWKSTRYTKLRLYK